MSSTPTPIPAAAGTYTTATQDPDMRSQVHQLLMQHGEAQKIQDQFLHSLQSHHANWPSTIQAHALALLRSGECTTFPALLRRVLSDIKTETSTAAAANASLAPTSASSTFVSSTTSAITSSQSTSSSSALASSSTPAIAPAVKPAATGGKTLVNGNASSAVTSVGPGAPMPKKHDSDAPPSLAIPIQVVNEMLEMTLKALESHVRLKDDED